MQPSSVLFFVTILTLSTCKGTDATDAKSELEAESTSPLVVWDWEQGMESVQSNMFAVMSVVPNKLLSDYGISNKGDNQLTITGGEARLVCYYRNVNKILAGSYKCELFGRSLQQASRSLAKNLFQLFEYALKRNKQSDSPQLGLSYDGYSNRYSLDSNTKAEITCGRISCIFHKKP